jgi:O-acetyl-ADP-ribose deacetylase
VSAGPSNWPLEDAARIAITTVARTPTAVREVVFVLFGSATYGAFTAAAEDFEIEP